MENYKMSYILASKCYSVSLYFHWKEKCRNSERMHVQLTWYGPLARLFFLTIVFFFFLMVERYLKSTTYLYIQGKWTKIHLHYFFWYQFINAITEYKIAIIIFGQHTNRTKIIYLNFKYSWVSTKHWVKS